jgi:ribosomal protein S7
MGNHSDAIVCLPDRLKSADIKDTDNEIHALTSVANALINTGKTDEAEKVFRQALAIAEDAKDPMLRAIF